MSVETTEENPASPVEGDEDTAETPTAWERAVESTREQAKAAVYAAQADAYSAVYRQRRQLAPAALAGGTGVLGAAGAAVATTPEVSLLAASTGTGTLALAAGYMTWRQMAPQLSNPEIKGRLKAGLAAGCAWCATLPLTGLDAVGMWLTLGAGSTWLASRWWQQVRPGYPDGPPSDFDGVTVETPAPSMTVPAAQRIVELWTEHITHGRGPLTQATLESGTSITNGRSFPVQLVPGRHTVDTLRAALPKVATAIGINASLLGVEPHDTDPSRAELRITDAGSMTAGTPYVAPRIVTDEQGTHIILGPYSDGEGTAKFTVFQEDSMRSGFLIGGTGSGKSRMLELIAIGLRELGVEVWFLDPQEGQSSPALAEHADWFLPGLGTDEEPYCHVEQLLTALRGAKKYRSRKLKSQGKQGFTHTPEMPGLMVIIDECKDVFEVKPDKAPKYGVQFGSLAKTLRKNGIGLLCAGHIYTLPTFGNDKQLRQSVTSYNLIALRTTEKSDSSLLPKGMPDPSGLPDLPGGGYISTAVSPRVAMFRAEYPAEGDFTPWLAHRPAQGLDRGTTSGAGDAYARRVEIAVEQERELARQLAMMESGEWDPDEEEPATSASSAPSGSSESGSILGGLPSISGGVIQRPSSGTATTSLTRSQQNVLSLLEQYEELSTKQLSDELGVSVQSVRARLRELGPDRVASVGGGVYRRI